MNGEIVVTGAAGFVGRALTSQLLKNGVSVTSVSRQRARGTTTVGSYADITMSENAVLIHLAQGRDASAAHGEEDIELCRALARMGWKRIVYASSAIVYGDAAVHAHKPTGPVRATSDYARVKLECENIVSGIGGTCLRFVNIYGPNMSPNTVIADILRQVPGSGPLRLRDAKPVRDFLWIEDAACCLVAASRTLPGRVLNAGSGTGISVGDVARLTLSLAGEGSRPVVSTTDSKRPSCLTVDIAETKSALDWSPKVDISSGLSSLLRLKKNGK